MFVLPFAFLCYNVTFHRVQRTGQEIKMKEQECEKCGKCCQGGGPAIHFEDLALFQNGALSLENLVTVRKGEPVLKPLSDKLHLSDQEFVKISGSGVGWACSFLSEKTKLCQIYSKKPLECNAQKCWDEKDILNISKKEKAKRVDFLPVDSPLEELINYQEREYPFENITFFYSRVLKEANDKDAALEIENYVNFDLAFRRKIIDKYDISLQKELFLLGRPLFRILKFPALSFHEENGLLRLSYP